MASRLLISCVCDDRFWVGERGGGPTARCPAGRGYLGREIHLQDARGLGTPVRALGMWWAVQAAGRRTLNKKS